MSCYVRRIQRRSDFRRKNKVILMPSRAKFKTFFILSDSMPAKFLHYRRRQRNSSAWFCSFRLWKCQPPPVRCQTTARCTVAVPCSKLMSFHCKPRYSWHRIPLANAKENTVARRSPSKVSRNKIVSSLLKTSISFGFILGNCTSVATFRGKMSSLTASFNALESVACV